MKINRLLPIANAIELMGLNNEDMMLCDPIQLFCKGADAEVVEWAKQQAKDHKMAKVVAANTACKSNFVALSFIANPADSHPFVDFDCKKNEAWMCVGDGRIFTFDRATNKVTGFDTQEFEPAFESAGYPDLESLRQMTDKARERAVSCLN